MECATQGGDHGGRKRRQIPGMAAGAPIHMVWGQAERSSLMPGSVYGVGPQSLINFFVIQTNRRMDGKTDR